MAKEWFETPATKGDVYYLGYTLLSAVFASLSFLYIEIDYSISLVVMGVSVVCLSLAFACTGSGYNYAVWNKVITLE
jgi:multidrug transporter EmrE-like cation transporter